MKIIFLDFDGVIALEHKHEFFGAEMRLSVRCISFLNKIIAKTGAVIVVTSSWRINRNVEKLQALLEDKGFVGRVIDMVEVLEDWFATRDDEIKLWLNRNGMPDSFILIDDQDVPKFNSRLVKTKPNNGLSQESEVGKAISLLNDKKNIP